MRHAFDADHIAAIDNTSRKLMSDHQRPLSVGFWFSLGHSSIVFVLAALLALGVRALAGPIAAESSALQHVTHIVGAAVSGTFLYLIGIVNLVILFGIVKAFRRMRHEVLSDDALEAQLANRGVLTRVLATAMRTVRKPWQMYPIGLAFGFGFDTATEVSLLVLAGGAAAFSLPWYAVLTLPVLFAAGMTQHPADVVGGRPARGDARPVGLSGQSGPRGLRPGDSPGLRRNLGACAGGVALRADRAEVDTDGPCGMIS
jgi:high-affinity nickel-transport protein